jgi:hypothetical protein
MLCPSALLPSSSAGQLLLFCGGLSLMHMEILKKYARQVEWLHTGAFCRGFGGDRASFLLMFYLEPFVIVLRRSMGGEEV